MFCNQELKQKQLVIKAGNLLSEKGLVERTWGNVSSRINGHYFAISPTGASYTNLIPEDIPVINLKNLSFIGSKKPSSELLIHSIIYNRYSKVSFILHTHQRFASLLSLFFLNKQGSIAVLGKYENVLGKTIPVAEYAEAGTKKIAENMVKAFVETQEDASVISKGIVLMAAHGVVCFAPSFDEAFNIVEILEDFAKTLVLETLKKNEIFLGTSCDLKTYSKDNFCNNKVPLINKLCSIIFTALPSISFVTLNVSSTSMYVLKELEAMCFRQKSGDLIQEIPTYFDDVAQIIGECTPVIYSNDKDALFENVSSVLSKNCNALLVQGVGVLCFSQKEDETIYIASIFEKNALAFLLSLHNSNIKPLSKENANHLHISFMQGYSKLKNE